MTIKVEVSGFSNQEQAELFIKWYDGSGEQDFGSWAEEKYPDFSTCTDTQSTFPISWDDDITQLVLHGDS